MWHEMISGDIPLLSSPWEGWCWGRVETDIITTSDLRQDIAEWSYQYFTRWNIIIFSAVMFCQLQSGWLSGEDNTHGVVVYLYSNVTGESLIQLQPTRHLVFLLPPAPPARISQSTYGAPIVRYLIINFSWTGLFAQPTAQPNVRL